MYKIMHKTEAIALADEENITEIINKALCPHCFVVGMPLYRWLDNRCVDMHRSHSRKLFKALRLRNSESTAELIVIQIKNLLSLSSFSLNPLLATPSVKKYLTRRYELYIIKRKDLRNVQFFVRKAIYYRCLSLPNRLCIGREVVSRQVKQVVVYMVNAEENVSISEENMLLVSPERREKIRRLRFAEDKRTSLICGMLIQYCAGKALRLPHSLVRTDIGRYGKPYHPDHPWYHFSVSHTRSCVVYTNASVPVGIDVEQYALLDKTMYSIAQAHFTAEEFEAVRSSSDRASEFFRIWTAKEAFLKCTGEGLTRSLDSFGVFSLPQGYELSQTVYGKNYVSVCCKGKCNEIVIKEIAVKELLAGLLL